MCLPPRFSEKARWLIQRLVGKTESAPMGRDEDAVVCRRARSADLKVGGNRFLGTHMYGLHEPARLISADGENRRIKRSQATSNLAELGVETRVTAKENSMAADADDPPAPKCGVSVPWITPGEMLRRSAPCRWCSRVTRLPPVHLDDVGRASFFQKITDAEGGKPFRARKSRNNATHCLIIEMIVVVVRDENCVDGRKLLEEHTRRRVSPRSGKLNRGSPFAPDWIGKDADSVRLDEEAAVAYPGDGKSDIVGTRS